MRRVVGVDLRVKLDFTTWRFCWPTRDGRCLGLGPLRVWLTCDYDDRLRWIDTEAQDAASRAKTFISAVVWLPRLCNVCGWGLWFVEAFFRLDAKYEAIQLMCRRCANPRLRVQRVEGAL